MELDSENLGHMLELYRPLLSVYVMVVVMLMMIDDDDDDDDDVMSVDGVL